MLKAELVKENERLMAVEREHAFLLSNNIAQAKRREGQFEGFREKVVDLQDDKKRLKDELEGLEKRFESLAKQDIRFERERDEFQEENRKLKEKAHSQAREIEYAKKDLKDTHKAYDEAKVEVYDLGKENHQLVGQVLDLEDAKEDKKPDGIEAEIYQALEDWSTT